MNAFEKELKKLIMNDRYLFKAKRVNNGEWVTGSIYTTKEKTYIVSQHTQQTKFISTEDWVRVIPDTVCQCTGLPDKNDKLIFEEDKFYRTGRLYTVKFIRTCFIGFTSDSKKYSVDLSLDLYNCHKDIEIIGNVHDSET